MSQLQLEIPHGGYTLESDPKFLGFKSVEVTKVDETKPWKPPLEVKVVKADGTEETIDAATPFFTFVDKDLKRLAVSAADAGHIQDLHIKGTDAGSRFDHTSLEELFLDMQDKLPAGIAATPGPSAFDMEMGKGMGKEGIATLQELLAEGVISQADIFAAEKVRNEVLGLNKGDDKTAKEAFVARFKEENPTCKVQFQVVRGAVIVPVVSTPKRPTTKLFVVFGPDDKGGKTMWTAAPGRNMPRHPNPKQFREEEGGTEGSAYQESANAWFETAMLTG